MSQLQGLPDRKDPIEVEEYFGRSSDRALKILQEKGGATASGDCGSINIWQDDQGFLRGVRLVYFNTKAGVKTKKETSLKSWLETQMPLLDEYDEAEG